jgi:glycosyltransferase involved in cell wall biosynthesis
VKILIIAPMVPQFDAPGATPVLLDAQLGALAGRHELTLVAGVGDEPWEAPAADAVMRRGLDVHLADRRRPATARRRMRRRARLASEWLFERRPWTMLWFATPAVQAIVDDMIGSRQFDLVAVEDSSMSMLRLPPGVPAVLSEHEVRRLPVSSSPRGGPAIWLGWVFQRLDWRRNGAFQRAAWERYDRIQVFTDGDARAVVELAPEVSSRVRVNPFGLAMPALADPSREQPGTVLFTGNFTHGPNRDAATWLVREIMPRVRAESPAARLQLVGSVPTHDVVELAGDGVELIADVPDVDPYLETASVCVAPVRAGGGMRMKVLYALAYGKAVVTTTLGAEGFARSGCELPMMIADDTQRIAAAIAALLNDDSRRLELGRRAREFAERYHSLRAWGARLDEVYEEACREARSGS